jgi:hypothetical protein
MPKKYGKKKFQELYSWYIREVRRTYSSTEDAQEELNSMYREYGHEFEFVESEESSLQQYEAGWDFREEMTKYCRSDVILLREGCNRFREAFKGLHTQLCPRSGKVAGVYVNKGEPLPPTDPFSFVTTPSFCYDMYLRNFYENRFLTHFDREDEKWIRRGFGGGRTEAIALYKRCRSIQPGVPLEMQEHIRKVDFCSQYPFVCAEGYFTGGQPTTFKYIEQVQKVLREEFNIAADDVPTTMEQALLQWFMHTNPEEGLDKVGNPSFHMGLCMAELSFMAPQDLYLPVIGCKDTVSGTGKFIFDCMPHVDVVVNCLELHEAIVMGYKVWDVKRITWWRKENVRHGIFRDYVAKFLGVKLEAAGWPADCVGNEEKQLQHIEKLEANNPGVTINRENVGDTKNHGRYACAKIALNSVWGKTVQRSNFNKTEFFTPEQYEEYYKLFTDPTLICRWDEIVDGKIGMVTYKSTEETYDMTKNTCVTVGVWTTAQGRLMLYRQMKKLASEQVLYMDTDSIVYSYDPSNEYHCTLETTADTLGRLSDEFIQKNAKGQVCVEFVSGGPKNYGCMFVDAMDPHDSAKRTVDLKIKGHNLTAGYADSTSPMNNLTYDKVRSLVITHALKEHPALQIFALQEAAMFATPECDFKPNGSLDEDQFIQKEEEAGVLTIPVTYKGRFTLCKALEVTHRDVMVTYGWSYDKRVVNLDLATTQFIPTSPWSLTSKQSLP